MKNENKNNEKVNASRYQWNHHCLNSGCCHIWDSDDPCAPCPRCASGEHETLCFIPELADWNCVYPGVCEPGTGVPQMHIQPSG